MATNPDPNGGVYYGPYIDPALTKTPAPHATQAFGQNANSEAANPPGTVPDASPADAPGSEPSGPTTLGEVKVYDTPAVNHEPGDQGAVPPPHSPNKWAIEDDAEGIPRSRDYYRNDGMIGQDFLKNQG